MTTKQKNENACVWQLFTGGIILRLPYEEDMDLMEY